MNTKTILALACAGLVAATAGAAPIGVTVNSVHLNDDASITADGWTYNSQTGDITFHGSGNFMVSGSNVAGKARIIIPNGVTNTVRFWNLTLRVTNDNQCIFALGTNACVSLFLKGTNTLASGQNRAGIEVPAGASLLITNSSVNAADALTAIGGENGAGIGGGNGSDGGTVTINGVRVTATGGNGSAGIGGGNNGAGGSVMIFSGTVFAQGMGGGADIGPGANGAVSGSNTFTGGSIRIANNSIAPIPSNGTARVWCVTVTNLTPDAAVVVTGLGPAYGVNDLFADNSGKIYLWLPNNGYDFTAGDNGYEATVTNADTVATLLPSPTPVSNAYITFVSASAFTVKPQEKSWNGRLHYSTNATKWAPFGAAGATAADNGAGEHKLYLCGTSNTCIIGAGQSGWTINAMGNVTCSGNIETLLDHAEAAAGEHPMMNAYCFAYLFKDCTALISAPALPATNLADYCYFNMFNRCAGLAQAPALPATTLAYRCYDGMFNGCMSLTQAPMLPATTLTHACYGHMFYGCTGLTSAPALSATTLASDCYYKMFCGCTGLTSVPELPATNLAEKCYYNMFHGCTGITLYADGTGPTWGIPDGAIEQSNWNSSMLVGTGGTFTNNPEIGETYYYVALPPGVYITFSSTNTFTVKPQQASWNGTIQYSTDATTWTSFTIAGATALGNGSGEYKLYLRGTSNTCITGSGKLGWQINASAPVACSGNIETLLDYRTVANGGHPAMANHCFENLFLGCANLSKAPTLPATNLTESCYYAMFRDCTGLTETPAELPATTLAKTCYYAMFYGCTALTSAPVELPATNLASSCYAHMFGYTALTQPPALPATILTNYCYYNMFQGCAALTSVPAELPTTNLADSCYNEMFKGCTALTQAPTLPAKALATSCYAGMFQNCTSLTNAPALPATTLTNACYYAMFQGCTGLIEVPALPATTMAKGCYSAMFYGCSGLTRLPALPATNLAENCYHYMFADCTGIKLDTEGPGTPWGIPHDATEQPDWNRDMLIRTGGAFTGDPQIGVTYFVLSTPAAPSGVSASDGTFTNKIRITWNASDLATGYTVWRHTANSSAAATEIGSAAGTTYDDVATVAKTTYYYWVKATNAAGVSGFSTSDSGWRAEPKPPMPAVPTGVAASDGAHTDKVSVTWKASAGATSYKVYRYTSNNPNAASQIGISTTTTYNDTTAKTELTYYYWVKAVNESGASGFSALDTGYLGVVGPLVTVNGMVGNNIRIPANKPITITATMMNLPAVYLGVPVDWWVAAYVHQGGLWFYFDTNFNLVQFDGNLANVRPAYQGPLYNVPPLPLVEKMLLPRGTYNVWFAVDYPMDGKIHLDGLILLSSVTIVVE
jgi:hypothetical protein